jgi:hypothetical protein
MTSPHGTGIEGDAGQLVMILQLPLADCVMAVDRHPEWLIGFPA